MNKVEKLGEAKQPLQKSKTTDFETTEIFTNGKTYRNKSNVIKSSKANSLAQDLQKEIYDALAQFHNNDDSFWMGDQLDLLIDAEISEEEDKTVDKSLSISQEIRKVEKADTLELGSIDYSWMESLADDSDSDCHLAKDSKEVDKKTDKFKLDSLDYSWMDSMGCASDIEEDDLNSDEINTKDTLQADEKENKPKDTEAGFKEKAIKLFEDRRNQDTGEMLDVGHFCAA